MVAPPTYVVIPVDDNRQTERYTWQSLNSFAVSTGENICGNGNRFSDWSEIRNKQEWEWKSPVGNWKEWEQ